MSIHEAAEIYKAAHREIDSWNSCYREPGTVEPNRVIVSRFAKSLTDPAPITAEALAAIGVERYTVEEYYGAREEANLVMWEPLADGGVNIMVNFATVNITTLGQLTALLLALTTHTTPRGEAT